MKTKLTLVILLTTLTTLCLRVQTEEEAAELSYSPGKNGGVPGLTFKF